MKIWIHTDVDNGYVWSWTPNNEWEINAVSALSTTFGINKIRSQLAHTFTYDLSTIPSGLEACWATQNQSNTNRFGINNLNYSYFKTAEINFNTNNPPICLPNYYYSNGTQVHRLNQNYMIEIFLDNDPNIYLVLDNVNMIDMTLNEYASDYEEEEIQDLFRFFKSIALGLASRVSATTSGTFESAGGSRLEARYHPFFGNYTQAAGGQFTEISILR